MSPVSNRHILLLTGIDAIVGSAFAFGYVTYFHAAQTAAHLARVSVGALVGTALATYLGMKALHSFIAKFRTRPLALVVATTVVGALFTEIAIWLSFIATALLSIGQAEPAAIAGSPVAAVAAILFVTASTRGINLGVGALAAIVNMVVINARSRGD